MPSQSTASHGADHGNDARVRRLAVTFALGFASGLPLALSSGTLTYFLARHGLDERAVGLFGLASIPYTAKFAWAPIFDRVRPGPFARLGQRRGWLLLAQLGLFASIVATGFTDPARLPIGTMVAAMALAFFSASQDVIIDALRVETLAERDQGWGAALTMWGYRIGMLASGFGALHLADLFPFRLVYGVMAGLALLGSLVAWFAIEPPRVETVSTRSFGDEMREAVVEPFRQLAARQPILLLAVFLAVFRLGDAWAGQMSNVYLVGVGFTGAEIANVTKLVGVIATAVGVGVGGFLVSRVGAARLLPFAAVIMAFSNVGYAWLATRGHRLEALSIAVIVEYFTSGTGQAITVAWLSSLCERGRTATQYAVLTAMISTSRTLLVGFSGFVVEWARELAGPTGNAWSLYFLLTAFAGIPGIILAFPLSRRTRLGRVPDEVTAASPASSG